MWFWLSLLGKAVAAIDRTVVTRTERNLTLVSAGRTDSVEHLARASPVVFVSVAASFAALRLVGKSLFLEEILLARGEHEFLAAILANQSFVLMNQM